MSVDDLMLVTNIYTQTSMLLAKNNFIKGAFTQWIIHLDVFRYIYIAWYLSLGTG